MLVLKPGTKYASEHPDQAAHDGERIPLLRDLIRLVRGTSVKLWIELKSNFMRDDRTAPPDVFAEKVIALLRAERAVEQAIIIGFDWRALVASQRIAPEIPVWFTTLPQSWFGVDAPPPAHWPPPAAELLRMQSWERTTAPWADGFDRTKYGTLQKAIKAGGGQAWFPFHPDLTSQSVAAARALGLKVGGWTVNEPLEMQRLIALGVDAICTDRPDILQETVRSSH